MNGVLNMAWDLDKQQAQAKRNGNERKVILWLRQIISSFTFEGYLKSENQNESWHTNKNTYTIDGDWVPMMKMMLLLSIVCRKLSTYNAQIDSNMQRRGKKGVGDGRMCKWIEFHFNAREDVDPLIYSISYSTNGSQQSPLLFSASRTQTIHSSLECDARVMRLKRWQQSRAKEFP